MAPERSYAYSAVRPEKAIMGLSRAAEYALRPPASHTVLEQLSALLSPPYSVKLQPAVARRGSGPYGLASPGQGVPNRADPSLRWAYDACASITRGHSKSFYTSARLLPAHKRDAIMALYAFCRLSDDTVDELDGGGRTDIGRVKARLALESWSRANSQAAPMTDHPVVVAWADTRARFGIPRHLADELLEGVRMDLTVRRYDTWDDLWLYCYRVASTVGLMSVYITGVDTMEAIPYAIQLGVALQLTNVLRDIGEDAHAGRVYLPREDMDLFGYTEEMLMDGTVNEAFVALMRFEIARARLLYAAAWAGIGMLPRDSRLAVAAAGTLYSGILDKIEEADYHVFTTRAHLSTGEKLRALPGLWFRTRFAAGTTGIRPHANQFWGRAD